MTINPDVISFIEKEIRDRSPIGITSKELYAYFDTQTSKIEVAKALHHLVSLKIVYFKEGLYSFNRRKGVRTPLNELRYQLNKFKSRLSNSLASTKNNNVRVFYRSERKVTTEQQIDRESSVHIFKCT